MSWKVLLVVIALGIVAVPRDGHAEKAKTNQATKLYSRAGEQAPVILKMKEGQTVTVLAKDGRWLKVRVSGRTGWVPRSKIDLPPEEDAVARNTRRRPFVDGRGTKRGFGGEAGPEDRVGADATGEGGEAEDKPAKASKASKEDEDAGEEEEEPEAKPAAKKPAKPEPKKPEKPEKKEPEKKPAAKASSEEEEEETVVVDDEEPAASEKKPEKKVASAEDEDEKPAKPEPKKPSRPTAHVAKATPAYAKPSADSDEQFTAKPQVALLLGDEKGKYTYVETEDGDSGYVLTSKLERDAGGDDAEEPGGRTRHIDLRGRLGLSRIGRSVSQAGGANTPPDNYSTAGASITLAVGGLVLYPYKTRLWVGGEGNYDLDKNLGGVTFMGQTTGLTYHNLNLRALIGYDLQNAKAMVVFGRLGLHYESFQVADVADLTKNTATIPSQNVVGPTIGVGLAIPKLSSKLGLRLSLDAMVVGASVTQTVNLEDGTGPSAKAVYVGGQLNYHLKPQIDLQGTLDIGYSSVSFSGPPPASSQRMHTGTGNVSSSDLATTLTFGIAYQL